MGGGEGGQGASPILTRVRGEAEGAHADHGCGRGADLPRGRSLAAAADGEEREGEGEEEEEA